MSDENEPEARVSAAMSRSKHGWTVHVCIPEHPNITSERDAYLLGADVMAWAARDAEIAEERRA